MDIKYNVQDLAEKIARVNKMSRKDAETFVRAFFDTISAFLLRDKIVKVKGLGTFKLVVVSDRESIDVNTGKRIVISGHSKVSFTPDNTLRDQVNKPFIDFETVILNDDTDTAEMERIAPEYSTIQEDNIEEDLAEDVQIVAECEEAGYADYTSQEEEGIEEDKEENANEDEDVSVSVPEEPEVKIEEDAQEISEEDDLQNVVEQDEANEPELDVAPASIAVEENVVTSQPLNNEEKDNVAPIRAKEEKLEKETAGETPKNIWTKIFKYACLFLLMIGSYFLGYYRVLCPCNFLSDELLHNDEAYEKVANDVDQIRDTCSLDVVSVDSICESSENKEDSIDNQVNTDNLAVQEKQETQEDVIEKYPQVPGGKYLIVGTRSTHVMKIGDNLYKLARTNYGSNDFVKYIIVYNQFKNPDVIPPGYTIKLPELKEVK